MDSQKIKRLLLIALTMIVFAATFQGQAHKRIKNDATPVRAALSTSLPTARALALNKDGSYDIEIGGQRLRALTGPQLDAWAYMEVELTAARARNENLQADNVALEKEKATLNHEKAELEIKFIASEEKVGSLTRDLTESKAATLRNFGLLADSIKSRDEMAGQFIPRTSAKGWWGKFLTVLDRPELQTTFKVGVPLFNAARCR
jgi:hypothetical protein